MDRKLGKCNYYKQKTVEISNFGLKIDDLGVKKHENQHFVRQKLHKMKIFRRENKESVGKFTVSRRKMGLFGVGNAENDNFIEEKWAFGEKTDGFGMKMSILERKMEVFE